MQSPKTTNTNSSQRPTYADIPNPDFAAIQSATTQRAKDHAAIQAMRGEHRVDFSFLETVVLEQGYSRKPPKNSGAFETVVVVESTPDRIVLQHLLVVGNGHVVKHWRQDWTYEASERFEFSGEQIWSIEPIAREKRKGSWTQCVYEVSDAPRYCGTGRWNHRYGVSTWTSDRTWRPLPRREYTTRDDYTALNVENRHTVTPNGWAHEQDNTKVLRIQGDTSKTWVREFGFNDYRRIEGYDFSSAYHYWEKTQEYWKRVRAEWSARLAGGGVHIDTEVDGMPIIEATFADADAIVKGGVVPDAEAISQLLEQWVKPLSLATADRTE